MSLLLIKIGKAWNVLKRDGILRGGKRIFTSFFAMFRRVKPGDVLFVTNGVGDSALYRTHHVVEELEAHGFKCSVTVQDNPFLLSYADKFKVFVFHRTLYTDRVRKLIEEIKKKGKEIIFETDDLTYDRKYLEEMSFFKEMNSLEKKLYENVLGAEVLNDSWVKVCTTTTSYLANKLREKGKQVFVVPNRLSDKDLETVDEILKKKSSKSEDKIKLGYFSGTISHNKDFAIITDALMEIMEKHNEVELFLAGPLDIESTLNKFKNRIKQLPYTQRNKHFENISSVDINLVPLEKTSFTESKSELKFFEAGILGIPTVATDVQTFREAIEEGVDGFTAGSTEEWIEKLERLITDESLRKEIGEKAREKSLQKYTNKNSTNGDYYEYLEGIINK